MPIYVYRCNECGFAQDVLQKISDPERTVCPACGQSQFRKQVTAAGFQLKGSGWYATDFKNTKSPAASGTKKGESSSSDSDATSNAASAAAPNTQNTNNSAESSSAA